MLNKKAIWILTFLMLIFVMFLPGCLGTVIPKTAEIEITFDPNPVPVPNEGEDWKGKIIFTECNGIGITLTSVTFDYYNQDEKIKTSVWDEEWIEQWFGSNYLPAFGLLERGIGLKVQEITHQLVTATGVDDNGYQVESTITRVDFLSL